METRWSRVAIALAILMMGTVGSVGGGGSSL